MTREEYIESIILLPSKERIEALAKWDLDNPVAGPTTEVVEEFNFAETAKTEDSVGVIPTVESTENTESESEDGSSGPLGSFDDFVEGKKVEEKTWSYKDSPEVEDLLNTILPNRFDGPFNGSGYSAESYKAENQINDIDKALASGISMFDDRYALLSAEKLRIQNLLPGVKVKQKTKEKKDEARKSIENIKTKNIDAGASFVSGMARLPTFINETKAALTMTPKELEELNKLDPITRAEIVNGGGTWGDFSNKLMKMGNTIDENMEAQAESYYKYETGIGQDYKTAIKEGDFGAVWDTTMRLSQEGLGSAFSIMQTTIPYFGLSSLYLGSAASESKTQQEGGYDAYEAVMSLSVSDPEYASKKEKLDKLVEKGELSPKLIAHANIVGAAEAVLEKTTQVIAGRMFGNLLGAPAKVVNKSLTSWGLSILKDGGAEGLSESGTLLLSKASEYLVLGDEEAFNNTLNEFIDTALIGTFTGTSMSGVGAGAGVARQVAQNKRINSILKQGNSETVTDVFTEPTVETENIDNVNQDADLDNVNELNIAPVTEEAIALTQASGAQANLNTNLKNRVKLGDITTEKSTEIKDNFIQTQQAVNQLKSLGIEKDVQAVGLLKEKNKLTKDIDSSDKGAAKPLIEKVAKINQELGKIVVAKDLQALPETLKGLENVEVKADLKTTADVKSFLETKIKENKLKKDFDIEGALRQPAFIVQDSELGTQEIVMNPEVAGKEFTFDGDFHETGHAITFETIRKSPEVAIVIGNALDTEIAKLDIESIKDSNFKKRLKGYEQSVVDGDLKPEELADEKLQLFGEGLLSGDIKTSPGIVTKVKDFIRQTLQNAGIVDVKFDESSDVLNFIKDYSKRFKDIKAGKVKGLGKGLTKAANKGISGDLISEGIVKKETNAINDVVVKFTNSESGRIASEKVQEIYATKGKEGSFEIIEQFGPIVSKIVNKRRDAPNFDEQLLTDEINTGKRGIIDLVAEYKPESKVPLAAYINKYLPARAIEASQRVLGEEFTSDVTEAKGVASSEQEVEVDTDKSKKTKPSKVLNKEQYKKASELVAAKMESIDPNTLTFKNLGNITTEATAEAIGIPAAKISDPKKNLSKPEANAAQRFVLKNVNEIKRTLPNGFIESGASEALLGTSTGIAGSLLNNEKLFTKQPRGKKGSGIFGYKLKPNVTNANILEAVGIVDGKMKDGFSARDAQALKGLLNIYDRNIASEIIRAEQGLTPSQNQDVQGGDAKNRTMFSKEKTKEASQLVAEKLMSIPTALQEVFNMKIIGPEAIIDRQLDNLRDEQKSYKVAQIDYIDNVVFPYLEENNIPIPNWLKKGEALDMRNPEHKKAYSNWFLFGDASRFMTEKMILGSGNFTGTSEGAVNAITNEKIRINTNVLAFANAEETKTTFENQGGDKSKLGEDLSDSEKESLNISSKKVGGITIKSNGINVINPVFKNKFKNGDFLTQNKQKQKGAEILITKLTQSVIDNPINGIFAIQFMKASSTNQSFFFRTTAPTTRLDDSATGEIIEEHNPPVTSVSKMEILPVILMGDINKIKPLIKQLNKNYNQGALSVENNTILENSGFKNDIQAGYNPEIDNAKSRNYNPITASRKKPDGTSGIDPAQMLTHDSDGNLTNDADLENITTSGLVITDNTKAKIKAAGVLNSAQSVLIDPKSTTQTQIGKLRDIDKAMENARKPNKTPREVVIKSSEIKALGINTPTGIANFIVSKAAEGFNDFKFDTPALGKSKIVQSVLGQLDISSPLQRIMFSKEKTFDNIFNNIIEDATGIEAYKEYSPARAKTVGVGKGKFSFLTTPSAEDFNGLLYKLLGKGKVGDAQQAFFKANVLDPYNRAEIAVTEAKISAANDYKALKRNLKTLPKSLSKPTGIGGFTFGQAARVAIWTRQGMEVPGMSKRDIKELNSFVEANSELNMFANELITIQKGKAYPAPSKEWLAGTITSDIINEINKVNRKEYLQEWQENVDIIFSEKNLNKLEAAYGANYVEALRDQLARMKSGSNRPIGGSRIVNNLLDWLNNSVGAVMFLNTRSAVLQTISAVNFINFGDNNLLKAGKAFANQKQYWGDFMKLFNSPYLTERRDGLKINVSESEIADAVSESSNKPKAFLNMLLNKGFIMTRIADSFAIAAGGSTFYRNRMEALIESGMDVKAAEKQAFDDFYAIAETNQQSSNPSKISQQQASAAGRVILAFSNTPMQYNRIIKRASQDLINKRGDWKSNVSKIVYYAGIQNLAFNALQSALFASAFEDDEEQEDKTGRIANGMADSLIRGLGIQGAATVALKDALTTIYKENNKEKGSPKFEKALFDLFGFSPPLDAKVRKLKSAANTFSWEKKRMKESSFNLNNPAYLASSQLISGITNVPLDRAVQKVNNLRAIFSNSSENWQKVALAMGWSTWDVGLPYYGVDDKVEMTPQMILKEKVTTMSKETSTKEQKDLLLELGLTKQQIKALKYEDVRVKKIIELQENKK